MEIFLIYFSVISGVFFLIWSADKFVDGASITANHFGMPPLLIGMLIIGFGTSTPEILVSALASYQGNPSIALGNAYGSNITNIALILGITAIINPVKVESGIIKKELPVLSLVTLFSVYIVSDYNISRLDAFSLLIVFSIILFWTLYTGSNKKHDPLALEVKGEMKINKIPVKKAIFWLVSGFIIMVFSSKILVWGAVGIAKILGISDLIIGLTIITVGTSLPELASSIVATRKGDHDLAMGNILGSNLINTLTVVGIAGLINPIKVPADLVLRDFPVMTILTLSLFIMSYGFRGQGRINRLEGMLLLMTYIAYTILLLKNIV